MGPPSGGELVLKVDPHHAGGSLVVGTQTLLPGAQIPVHRHLHHDSVWFIHKGQGRVTLNNRTATVVPGVMVYVPRQTWCGLRNTGTGNLQLAWTATPLGIEVFFRELSRLSGGAADMTALQALGQRYGVEFQAPGAASAGEAPSPSHRRRRHRGGRGRGRRHETPTPNAPNPLSSPAVGHADAPSAPASVSAPSVPAPSLHAERPLPSERPSGPSRHRRRRRRAGPQTPPVTPPTTPHGVPPSAKDRPPRRDRHRRSGRVKEVYMGGRWVPVVGEGPVIAPGRDRSPRSGRGGGKDDDTPQGPLSVSL